jgi:hypothetical protein
VQNYFILKLGYKARHQEFPALARHILDVAPKSGKIVFENDEVRVIEITMMKGQTVPMHSHKMGLSYSLNAGRIRSMTEDGRSRCLM